MEISYTDNRAGDSELERCRQLWAAKILQNMLWLSFGMCCGSAPPFLKTGVIPRSRMVEANAAYFFFTDDPHYNATCDAAGLDPDFVFDGAKRWVRAIEDLTGVQYHILINRHVKK